MNFIEDHNQRQPQLRRQAEREREKEWKWGIGKLIELRIRKSDIRKKKLQGWQEIILSYNIENQEKYCIYGKVERKQNLPSHALLAWLNIVRKVNFFKPIKCCQNIHTITIRMMSLVFTEKKAKDVLIVIEDDTHFWSIQRLQSSSLSKTTAIRRCVVGFLRGDSSSDSISLRLRLPLASLTICFGS